MPGSQKDSRHGADKQVAYEKADHKIGHIMDSFVVLTELFFISLYSFLWKEENEAVQIRPRTERHFLYTQTTWL